MGHPPKGGCPSPYSSKIYEFERRGYRGLATRGSSSEKEPGADIEEIRETAGGEGKRPRGCGATGVPWSGSYADAVEGAP